MGPVAEQNFELTPESSNLSHIQLYKPLRLIPFDSENFLFENKSVNIY